jgi:flagellar motor switch protein FliG
MSNDKLTGAEKAAILLYSLGEELSLNIVKLLNDDEMKRLGSSMAKIFSVSAKTAETIYAEFNDMASTHLPIQIGQGGTQFIKSILNKAVEKEKAQTIIDEIQEEARWNLFQKIKRLDPKTIANFIRNEHPQTIAIVLAHLSTGQTAGVLSELPGGLHAELVHRMAEMEKVPHAIVEEIDQAMQGGFGIVRDSEGLKRGGVRFVAEVLNQVDSSIQNTILKDMEEDKQSLADEIRRLMFVFEDLIQVDDRGIMVILKEVNNEVLIKALKTASDELKDKIFKNMSERAAHMMKEDLEVMGPVRLKDVETAQQQIISTGKKLENEGKIVLSRKGKEEIFV